MHRRWYYTIACYTRLCPIPFGSLYVDLKSHWDKVDNQVSKQNQDPRVSRTEECRNPLELSFPYPYNKWNCTKNILAHFILSSSLILSSTTRISATHRSSLSADLTSAPAPCLTPPSIFSPIIYRHLVVGEKPPSWRMQYHPYHAVLYYTLLMSANIPHPHHKNHQNPPIPPRPTIQSHQQTLSLRSVHPPSR